MAQSSAGHHQCPKTARLESGHPFAIPLNHVHRFVHAAVRPKIHRNFAHSVAENQVQHPLSIETAVLRAYERVALRRKCRRAGKRKTVLLRRGLNLGWARSPTARLPVDHFRA